MDVLESSRHVRVTVNGEVVAETHRPKILFETALPPRYYILREEVLVESGKSTQCPYKGIASYHSGEAGGERVEDLVWYNPEPIAAVEKIRDHLCLYNEKVDLEVDGAAQERPATRWS